MPNTTNIPRDVAIKRLTNRWLEQTERFPIMRNDIPLAHYISINVEHVMRYGLLADYDRA